MGGYAANARGPNAACAMEYFREATMIPHRTLDLAASFRESRSTALHQRLTVPSEPDSVGTRPDDWPIRCDLHHYFAAVATTDRLCNSRKTDHWDTSNCLASSRKRLMTRLRAM